MEYKDLESSKFYSYKFKNFSTMIILPAFLLVVFVLVGSVFAVREKTVKLVGIVEPTSSLNVKNDAEYYEGQIIGKGKSVVLNSERKIKTSKVNEVHFSGNNVVLFPNLTDQEIKVASYAPNDEISLLKNGQKIKFQIKNRYGENIIIDGKINSVAIYPKEVGGKEGYLVMSTILPTEKEKSYLRYGMESQVTVIISRQTYFNFLKDELFDKQ